MSSVSQDFDYVEGKHAWSMIWCHERCHKPDMEEFRKALQEAIEGVGGELVCLKKASVFERWLHRMQPFPYVMLCDWREAKPCMEVWEQLDNTAPRFTIVCTSNMKQFKVASKWAQGVRPNHSVHVIPSTSNLEVSRDSIMRVVQSNMAHSGLSTALPALPIVDSPPGLEAVRPTEVIVSTPKARALEGSVGQILSALATPPHKSSPMRKTSVSNAQLYEDGLFTNPWEVQCMVDKECNLAYEYEPQQDTLEPAYVRPRALTSPLSQVQQYNWDAAIAAKLGTNFLQVQHLSTVPATPYDPRLSHLVFPML